MKVAICLSGYFDSKSDTSSKGVDGFTHLLKHVISKCDKVDVYIHSWDMVNKGTILDLYKPFLRESLIEPQIDFSKLECFQPKPGYTSQRNILSHLYSVQKSFELLSYSNVDYDWVVKSRFDIGRINRTSSGPHNPQNPLPVQCINFNPTLDNKLLYLANWNYFDSEGPADMWFYSSKENMLKFTNIYNIIVRDMIPGSKMVYWAGNNDGGVVNPIKCYKWFLQEVSLWDIKYPLDTYWE